MKKHQRLDLIERLARRARISKAEAADRLDNTVHQLLLTLKQGKPLDLPGLGIVRLALKPRLFPAPAKNPPSKSPRLGGPRVEPR